MKTTKKPTLKNIKKSPTAWITTARAKRLVNMFNLTNAIKGMTMLIKKGYGANKGFVRVVFLFNKKAFSELKAY